MPQRIARTGPAAVRQDTYLRALATLPKVSVHLGVFYVSTVRAYLAHPPSAGPKTVEIIKTEEKGSDVALATYRTCVSRSESPVMS